MPKLHMYKILSVIHMILIMFPADLFSGEFSYTFDNSAGTADYLLGSVLVPDASYSSTAFTLSSILADNARGYIDFSHNQIYPHAEYSSTEAELGMQLRYLQIKDNQMFAGLFAYLNRFHDSYSHYNSSGFGLYMKWKYYFKASQLVIAGYDLNFNRFEELSEASNTDQALFLTYNQSFPSKTSVNFTSSFAYQNFWPESMLVGSGRNTYTVEVDSIPDNAMLTTKLRIGQSLTQKLGLTIWLDAQSLLNDESSTLIIQDGMNNPFIDRFRWEGNSLATRLLYRFTDRQSFKLSYSNSERNYIGVPVYAFDFGTGNYVYINDDYQSLGYDRSDRKQSFQLSWTVNIDSYERQWLTGMELVLNVGHIINSSNDPLYDYSGMNYNITLNTNN